MKKEEFINECIELRINKGLFYLYLFIFLGVTLFTIPIGLINFKIYYKIIIPLSLLIVPFIIYYYTRIKTIKSNFSNYIFLTVEFKNMHSAYKRRFYFTVTFEYNNDAYTLDTKCIFTSSIMDSMHLNFEEYLSNQVQIAFDIVKKEIIVIKAL